MSTVKVGENESIDNALRRFKRKCARDGIIGDLRKREAYEKPSVKRKKKAEAAGKPIAVINSMDYGMMRGDKILADALSMMQ